MTLRGIAGRTYHLCLDSSYYVTLGTASLDIHAVEGPANDEFDHRIVLRGAEGQRSGTVVNASHPVDDPWGYIDVLGTVWYEWQARSESASLWAQNSPRSEVRSKRRTYSPADLTMEVILSDNGASCRAC